MNRPAAPPEAVLIRLTREAANIRVSEAAKLAGVSTARWSQVESGHETRNGEYRQVRAKPGTIAHMAHAVGITPERLEAEGIRPDAAVILREIRRQEADEQDRRLQAVPDPEPEPAAEPAPASVPVSLDMVTQLVRPALITSATAIRAHAEAILARNPAARGADIFPAEPDLASQWDLTPALPVERKSWYAAIARFGRSEAKSGLPSLAGA